MNSPARRGDLRGKLRRSKLRARLRALLLILPALLLLIAAFLVPIGSMLFKAVDNPEMAENLPRVTDFVRAWDGGELPGEEGYRILAEEIGRAYDDKTLPDAAMRLNYEQSGLRSLLMRTGRRADRLEAPYKQALLDLDEDWGDIQVWRAMKAASTPYTARYLLQAVDREMTWDGEINRVEPEKRVFIDRFEATFWISFVVTALCVIVGYPMAYAVANAPPRRARLMLILVLLPFWTSLLVRTAAWVVLLQRDGIVNGALLWTGVVDEPVQLIFNRLGVYIAMTHILLPFMALPLYSVMKGISPNHVRAAASLGAGPFSAFWTVYFPQTIPGLGAGCLLVFVLAVGFYITPALVGGSGDQMISYLIATFAMGTANWSVASALAIVLLCCVAIFYPFFQRYVGIDRLKLG